MNTENKLTGYPSIDKPWLKYYSEEAINASVPECTIYEYLWENNKKHLNDVAIVYMGKKIKYAELFDNIDMLASAFDKYGIGDGDIVTVISPSIPEVIYSFYAINKIGAISNFIDPRKSPEELDDLLASMKSKAFIILDDMWGKFYNTVKKYKSKMFSVSVSDSLPLILRVFMSFKSKARTENEIVPLRELKKRTKECTLKNVHYKPNRLALLEYTGGTTGTSKAVMLSNENVNSVIEQTKYSGIPLKRGESWLSVAFPFIAYSLICSQHMPLSLGITAHLCFDLAIEKVEKQLLKHKVNHMANTPLMWEQLTKSKRASKTDFSFIIAPTVGADKLDVTKEKEINLFLEKHNCQYKLCKGYGMTEVSSGVCITPTNQVNKIGSVGIPFNLTTIGVFDVNTGSELKYGEQGEICIKGPSVMLGYYNNESANNEILRKHSDGQIWLHSGDLGHIDEDGFLFIDGRIKRMIIDSTGFKIFAPVVESVIIEVSGVDKCCVVGIKDTINNVGQIPIAYVVPNNQTDINALEKTIIKQCEKKLPTYSLPKMIIFEKSFPYTSANKIDYRALERMAEEQAKGN